MPDPREPGPVARRALDCAGQTATEIISSAAGTLADPRAGLSTLGRLPRSPALALAAASATAAYLADAAAVPNAAHPSPASGVLLWTRSSVRAWPSG